MNFASIAAHPILFLQLQVSVMSAPGLVSTTFVSVAAYPGTAILASSIASPTVRFIKKFTFRNYGTVTSLTYIFVSTKYDSKLP